MSTTHDLVEHVSTNVQKPEVSQHSCRWRQTSYCIVPQLKRFQACQTATAFTTTEQLSPATASK